MRSDADKTSEESRLPNRPDQRRRVRWNIRDGDRGIITIRLNPLPRKDHNQDEIQTKSGSNK